jgi:SAM-dependent methyltransferase
MRLHTEECMEGATITNDRHSIAWAEELIEQQDPPAGPFVRWHLRKKFTVMAELFQKYLGQDSRFADVGCGSGDALVLASRIGFSGEMWGLDMDPASLELARHRVPEAKLYQGDMHDCAPLPRQYFDIVHEFGAAFHATGWDVLARAYFSLLRDEGVLLWELPEKWSLAHISYLLNLAPKASADESRAKRLLRSFSPAKYRFESDEQVVKALQASGCDYEILESITIWHFFRPKFLERMFDWLWRYTGDGLFENMDRIARRVWPRRTGYYLVIRKKRQIQQYEG